MGMRSKIKKIVQILIKKYKTTNVYELAKCLGIILEIVPLGSYSGSYFYIKRRKVIFLNSCLNEYERIIVLSHEIGHSVLHKKTNCYFMKNKTLLLTSKIEREANIFACEYLIRDDILQKYEGFTFEQIACSECIPIELLKLKFNKI